MCLSPTSTKCNLTLDTRHTLFLFFTSLKLSLITPYGNLVIRFFFNLNSQSLLACTCIKMKTNTANYCI